MTLRFSCWMFTGRPLDSRQRGLQGLLGSIVSIFSFPMTYSMEWRLAPAPPCFHFHIFSFKEFREVKTLLKYLNLPIVPATRLPASAGEWVIHRPRIGSATGQSSNMAEPSHSTFELGNRSSVHKTWLIE